MTTTLTHSRVSVLTTVDEFRSTLDLVRSSGARVGFVPTMGALHEGHASLVARARAECDVVAVSVFVNPTQFNEAADLAAYPRTLEADLAVIAQAGGHLVFAPSVEEMYPSGAASTVHVAGLGDRWEGAARPGHFDGMATVVAKLFGISGACRAYFGEKDFQQLAIVRRMVADLAMPIEVVGCTTVREDGGLALSSRNTRLSPQGHVAARALSEALTHGAQALWAHGSVAAAEETMATMVADRGGIELDYAVVVRADDLEPAEHLGSQLRLLIAAHVDGVRLIDNLDPVGV